MKKLTSIIEEIDINNQINNVREEQIIKNKIKLNNSFNKSVNQYIKIIVDKKKDYIKKAKVKKGFVEKKSPNLFHGWQSRYMIVENNELKYFMNDNCNFNIPRGVLNFDFISISIIKEPYDPVFIIKVKNTEKLFYFKVNNINERDEWLEVIKNNVVNAKGNFEDLKCVEKIPKFWKYSLISYIDLVNTCESGDILLFNTKNLGATIQRTFTRSKYDHVGIILKLRDYDFLIFESLGITGVSTLKWSLFLSQNWQNLYEHISYRKLILKRDDDFHSKLYNFIKSNHGKKYGLDIQKLMKKESENQINDGTFEKESYFCSELVSTLFKTLGIIDSNKSSSNYWPGDFSDENNIDFKNGVSLGRQFKLIF